MVRLLPALLAVLLVLPAQGVALHAGGSVGPANDVTVADSSPAPGPASVAQTAPPPNTTRVLQLDDVQASNHTRPGFDLATSLSMQGSEMDGEFSKYKIETRLSNLRGEAKVQYALNETARLQAIVDEMLAAEERARQAYVTGDDSAEEYVRTLARLDTQARAIRLSHQHLFEYYRDDAGEPMKRPVNALRSDLVSLEGPIRQQSVGVLLGESSRFDLYLSASENGVVLSRIADDTFVREAYRADNVREGTPIPGLFGATETLQNRYPWAVGPDPRATGGPFSPVAWKWQHRIEHVRLTTYFHGNATVPYREIQYKSLPDYPFESSEQTISKNLVLTVNRTYPGGPMAVRLTNQTGTPLDGEVRFNGSTAGTTGEDGTLWALQPKGSFEVSVIHEGERLALEFEPSQAEFAGDVRG